MTILDDLVSVYTVTGYGFSLVHSLMYIFRSLCLLSENQLKKTEPLILIAYEPGEVQLSFLANHTSNIIITS